MMISTVYVKLSVIVELSYVCNQIFDVTFDFDSQLNIPLFVISDCNIQEFWKSLPLYFINWQGLFAQTFTEVA